MLETYQKFKLIDENKENEFYAEVNWDEKNDKTNKCQFIKFTFPDGKTSLIKKEYLLGMLFTMGTQSEQMKMIPQKNLSVKWYETIVGVKAKRDISKGEMINFPIKLTLPTQEEEAISELKAKYEGNLGIQKLLNKSKN